ncbi:MAG: phosphatase PAP2 family protein [Ruminococcaceae bacterium]|nr:phosphatase PAP2 family protein [Oscillospiraceae bacterium]
MNQLELPILDAIQTIKNPILDTIMLVITHLGDAGILWILTGVALLFFKKYRKNGLIVLFSLLAGLLITNIVLKNAVARIRPCDLNATVELLIERPHDWSFPSGHTTSSFAAATALLYTNKKIGVPALILAILIAFSRMYLYVHFPTDILAGIIIGAGCALLMILIFKKIDLFILKKKAEKA